MATIVVLVEQADGKVRHASLEALGAAAATGQRVVAALGGPGADAAAKGLGRHGAAKAHVFAGGAHHSPDRTAADLAGVVRAESAQAFLAAATSTGKDVLPRVAAHLDSVPLGDCTTFSWTPEGPEVQRPILAGKALATVRSSAPVFCATLRPNVFAAVEREGACEVVQASGSSDAKAEVVEVSQKGSDKLDVKEAPIVVSGGRGLKGPEHFHLLEELAAAFGSAAVGASRAVVDAGWRPHAEQVGQTGKTVAPQLYVAVGISGAIQHLAGMRTSKVIVAINKDADAPIFKVADYGIVGDAFEVVPALTAAVKAARSARS
jgi:electron transfer flavoprotein alpha subunit